MGFFKKLLGQGGNEKLTPQMEAFNQEWFAALKRFGLVAGFKDFQFELKHPKTGEVMLPHLGMAGSFEDWKQIKSTWDRRRLLFELIANTVARSLKEWNIANVLVAIRQPNRAVALLQQTPVLPSNATDYAQHCEAFARAYQYIQNPQEGVEWAKKAKDAKPEWKMAQVRFADVLFMTGECDEANAIYSSLMQSAKKSQNANIASMFQEMFALETGAVPSPVLAMTIGESLSNPQQAAEFWKLAELEFYDSPYFRTHHAYLLIKQGETTRAFAKLQALVQEMPWLREASLNLDNLFKHLDPNVTNLMPEFQQELRKTIKENGWTSEGMHTIDIEIKGKD